MTMLAGPVSKAIRRSTCAARGDECEVGDATEVLQHARAAGMCEEGGIEQRNQRRALSASDHVGRAEVGDDGRMDGGGNQRGLPELPGAGDAAACVRLRDALMVDGLTMTADEVECVSLRSCLYRVTVGLAEPPVEPRKFGGRCLGRVHCRKNRFAQYCGIGKGAMANQLDPGSRTCGRDAAERNVDAIGRGAAHDAGDEHRFLLRGHAIACGVVALTVSVKARTASRIAASSAARGGGDSVE